MLQLALLKARGHPSQPTYRTSDRNKVVLYPIS